MFRFLVMVDELLGCKNYTLNIFHQSNSHQHQSEHHHHGQDQERKHVPKQILDRQMGTHPRGIHGQRKLKLHEAKNLVFFLIKTPFY